MGRVRAGARDCREPVVGSRSQARESWIRRGTGLGLDPQGRPVRELEPGDIDREPFRMGRELAGLRSVPVTTLEAGAGADGLQLGCLDAGLDPRSSA